MYEDKSPIGQLVHLWIDGAFNRRELINKVVKITGSTAAALTALEAYPETKLPDNPFVPAGIRTAADDPELETMDVTFPGIGATIMGYLAMPKSARTNPQPAVIVVHENRGLLEHHRDVVRRVAKAGFVGLGVDLLSRQGGTAQFTEAAQQTAAYGRTNQTERRWDLLAGMDFLKFSNFVQFDRIGMVGFCAGGGNTWDFAINYEELAAAVPFYGAPAPNTQDVTRIAAPVLAIYAETDRNLTNATLPVVSAMISAQKSIGLLVYPGVGHAFHNDTGAAYNAEAAADAWAQTIKHFNKWLRRAR